MNRKTISTIVGVIFTLASTMSHAVMTSSFGTTFTANETLWQGTGIPATGFNESFTTGGSIGISGNAFANTGTVSSTVRGSLAATYDEIINPGSTNVRLDFAGSNSNISSAFGASAGIDAFVNVCVIPDPFFGGCITRVNETFGLVGVGASLQPSRDFTADLGTNSGSASDQQEVTSVGSLDLGVGRLGASVDLDFRQTISLNQTSIRGVLAGVNTNNGNTISRVFGINSSDMANVNLSGLDGGLWQFSILDVDLFNLFSNTASLVLEPTINYIVGSTAIATLNVPLITNSFSLDFNTLSSNNLFSIFVTPIPAAFWLFGTALVGFIGFARRRSVA